MNISPYLSCTRYRSPLKTCKISLTCNKNTCIHALFILGVTYVCSGVKPLLELLHAVHGKNPKPLHFAHVLYYI